VGFAAETENLRQEARRKLESKNCDMVWATWWRRRCRFRIRRKRSGAGAVDGETLALERASKREIADRIFDEILKLRLSLHATMKPDDLRRRLEFYQDIGVKTLYRQPAAAQVSDAETAEASAAEPAARRPRPRSRPPSSCRLWRRPATRCRASSKTLAIAAAAAARRAQQDRLRCWQRSVAAGVCRRRPGADEDAQEFHSSDAPVNC